MREKIFRALSTILLGALFYFAVGSIYRIYTAKSFFVQVLIPFWGDSNYAISIIIAFVFYFCIWKWDRVNAVAWFLFYDATYQMSNGLLYPTDASTIMFFLISVMIFYINMRKMVNPLILVLSWCMISIVTIYTGSLFWYQMIWACTIILAIKLEEEKEKVKPYIRN